MGIRAFSIHAHFYQPPRENPLTGSIPVEQSAAPYPNWNERIHAECYRPNADLGNYQQVSFNIGPTLFNWMAGHDPQTYTKIIAQDQANLQRHQVGNAMAQSYNHTILPLSTYQDKDHPDLLGHRRFHQPLQPPSAGSVAARNRRRYGNSGGVGSPGHPVHHPGALAGIATRPRPKPSLPGASCRGNARSVCSSTRAT